MTDDTATIEREIEKLSGQIIDVLVTWLTMNDVLNDLSLELTGEAVDVAARGIAAQEVQDHA